MIAGFFMSHIIVSSELNDKLSLFSSLKYLTKFYKMNFFKLIFISLFVIAKMFCDKNVSSMSRAFQDISKTFFELNGEVAVMNFGADKNLVDELVLKSLKKKSFPFIVEDVKIKENRFKITKSAVMTFESVEQFKKIKKKTVLTNKFPMSMIFIIYCVSATFQEISTIKEDDILTRQLRVGLDVHPNEMNDILHFQYFLVEEETIIKYLTFVWYTTERCSEPQLIEVNRFEKKLRKWKNSNFVLKKFVNFYGCRLVFGVWHQASAMDYFIFDNGNIIYFGYNYKIIKGLAKHLNFTFKFNPLVYGTNQYLFKNFTVDFLVLMGIFNGFKSGDNYNDFLTSPFIFTKVLVAVPPGEAYDDYEKLLLPFDSDTWTLIAFTFFVAFLTIFAINFASLKVKNFVFGTNVKTPSLNVTAIFFGISQSTLPRRNFARFLTMLFIIYCLIIRTAWQAKTFEFMQKTMRKSQIQSIDEFIEKNYSLYMMDLLAKAYSEMDVIKR